MRWLVANTESSARCSATIFQGSDLFQQTGEQNLPLRAAGYLSNAEPSDKAT